MFPVLCHFCSCPVVMLSLPVLLRCFFRALGIVPSALITAGMVVTLFPQKYRTLISKSLYFVIFPALFLLLSLGIALSINFTLLHLFSFNHNYFWHIMLYLLVFLNFKVPQHPTCSFLELFSVLCSHYFSPDFLVYVWHANILSCCCC